MAISDINRLFQEDKQAPLKRSLHICLQKRCSSCFDGNHRACSKTGEEGAPDFVNVSPKNFLRTKERYVDGVS